MHEDRLSCDSNREIFEAIVSQLDDPELVALRRFFLILGVIFFIVGVVAVAVLAGMGWPGVLAFSSTFLPAIVVARRFLERRFAG